MRVTSCYIALYYYMGFSFMMMRRYTGVCVYMSVYVSVSMSVCERERHRECVHVRVRV